MDKWINKGWPVEMVEYSSAVKRNAELTPAIIWMNVENIILSEISQTQKVT